jgi:cobalt-zinc-cadmium efflux system membrane fusion protein
VVEPAIAAQVVPVIRVPGTVQPNAYRQVSVTPLVGGRVTRVLVELGDRVARGAAIAEVYSPDAAEARARYLSAMADSEAGAARVQRTERLETLGSASRQELDQTRADYVRLQAAVREASARLRLIGIDPALVEDPRAETPSTITVTAPQAGVVTARPATVGMTAEPATVLATIADLSLVWIIADLYERDFALVGVGAAATATASGYPGAEWRGRVTYSSPDVRAETRTAQVRIEVPNGDGRLKFGMFVEAAISGHAVSGLTVPAASVQTIGADAVVFVPDPGSANVFRARLVKVGPSDGERVTILDGLVAGERLVTKGSFDLRAEAERQGVRPSTAVQSFAVAITASGFEPASLTLRRGIPAQLTFTRQTDHTCATALAIPKYGIRRELPLNRPVTVEFVPTDGDAVFQCGMGMLSGQLVFR